MADSNLPTDKSLAALEAALARLEFIGRLPVHTKLLQGFLIDASPNEVSLHDTIVSTGFVHISQPGDAVELLAPKLLEKEKALATALAMTGVVDAKGIAQRAVEITCEHLGESLRDAVIVALNEPGNGPDSAGRVSPICATTFVAATK